MANTYVVGDIHGCRRALGQLLGRINPDPVADTLVFLGDYIDRGPDSCGVIGDLIALGRKFTRLVFLKGNHEAALLDYLAGRPPAFFLAIGGAQTLASYDLAPQDPCPPGGGLPVEHLQFFVNLLPYWEDEAHIYVHAGLEPGVHLTQQSPQWLYWADGAAFAGLSHDFGKRVVFGHYPMETPLVMANKIGIDCGAVYGGHLTCLILPEQRFVRVRSEKFWPVAPPAP